MCQLSLCILGVVSKTHNEGLSFGDWDVTLTRSYKGNPYDIEVDNELNLNLGYDCIYHRPENLYIERKCLAKVLDNRRRSTAPGRERLAAPGVMVVKDLPEDAA